MYKWQSAYDALESDTKHNENQNVHQLIQVFSDLKILLPLFQLPVYVHAT